jgi:DNA-binding NtrC family response regulator
MNANGRILYVGDAARPVALDLVLEGQGYQISTARNVKHALRVLELRDFEAMLVEQKLLQEDPDQWRELSAGHPGMPVLGISQRA